MKRRLRRLSENKYTLMGAVIALLVLIALVSILMGGTKAVFPFGHIYRVEEVVAGDAALEETPTVYLTADSHLLLESRDRLEYADMGGLQELEESLWAVTPRGTDNQRYEVRLEGEDEVYLALNAGGEVQWEYRLSRVDTATCAVGTDEPIRLQWFAGGVFDSGDYDLTSGGTVSGEGTLTFTVEDETAVLTVTEEYYADGEVDSRTYELEMDAEGNFLLPVQTKTAKNNEYAVYRLPYEGGEYIFQVNFR